MSKAKKVIDDLDILNRALRKKKAYRGDVSFFKCYSCGVRIPPESVEWVAVGASNDPYRPFCLRCAQDYMD